MTAPVSMLASRLLRPMHWLVWGPLCVILAACLPSYGMTSAPSPRRTCPEPDRLAGVVDWYFPEGSEDNEQLDLWCQEVGPVVIDSLPMASFGALRGGDSLAIAVWNTDAGAGYLEAFVRTEMGVQCAGPASRLRPSATHFVVLVQEALRRTEQLRPVDESWSVPPPVKEERHPGSRLGVDEVAAKCGLSVVYAPAGRNGGKILDGKGEDKGTAILSTLPLRDFIVIELPYEAARRVVVAATVHDDRGDSLRIASVHLIATPPPWRVLQTGNSSRLRQALATVDALHLAEARRSPLADTSLQATSTVIAGDLNTWSVRETTLKRLFTHFRDSPGVLDEPTRGPFPTDHLLFRKSDLEPVPVDGVLPHTYRRVDDAYYSDHHPIMAWFRFGGERETAADSAASARGSLDKQPVR